MKITFSKSTGLTVDQALSREWLETNGLGGYASSSLIGCNTRKYHGLLISELQNPIGKYVLFSQLQDSLMTEGRTFLLSATQYTGCFQSDSFEFLQSYEQATHPVLAFQWNALSIQKEIIMPYGENAILIKYTITSPKAVTFQVRPLIAYRDFHALTRENQAIQSSTTPCIKGKAIAPYPGMPTLFFQIESSIAVCFTDEPVWYRNLEYREEKNRGYDYREDLFSPGYWTASLLPGRQEILFSAGLMEETDTLSKKWDKEITRRQMFQKKLTGTDDQKQLQSTARSFSYTHEKQLSLIAGYHWFLAWGRDAMISIPGLTLCFPGFEQDGFEVLKTFASRLYHGLIPNFLGLTKDHDVYNSVDASLWFGWAVQQYYLTTKNIDRIARYLWQPLKDIFHYYKKGTLHRIKMNALGLIDAGHPGVNLTWMDAMIGGEPVTPRYGMAVEINALWYNFVLFMNELCNIFDDPLKNEITPSFTQTIKESFNQIFWHGNEILGYLKDVVNTEFEDRSLRPNQIFAASLPYSPISQEVAEKMLTKVASHLLTPYGLRTLSPTDKKYCPHYQGGYMERDRAYHNGTVWPWLLGHFGEAWLKIATDKERVKNKLQDCLNHLFQHVHEAGMGSISEIFDGNFPHTPRGCISQAWSVAEVLRLSYLLQNY